MTRNNQNPKGPLVDYDFLIAIFLLLVAIGFLWANNNKREPTPAEIDIIAEKRDTQEGFHGPQVEFFPAGGSGR